MTPEQLAQVGDDADDALQKGDLARALSLYAQLEAHEPKNVRWAGGQALALRKLGRREDEIEALARVARIHVDKGDTLRAIATLQHVLTLAPGHAGARRALAALSATVSSSQLTPVPGSRVVRPMAHESGPLDRLSLHQVVTSASPHRGQPSVHRIPLHGEDDATSLLLGGPPGPRPRPPPKREDFSIEEALVEEVANEVRTATVAEALLPQVGLFSKLDGASFDKLVLSVRPVSAARGEEIFHQGDPSDALYIVAEGEVGVVDEGPPRRGVAKLGPGGIFGEIGMVTDRPRMATVIALRPTELLAVDRAVIRKLIADSPDTLLAMLAFVRDRLISRLIATHPLFSVLSKDDAERIQRRVRFLEVLPGATMIEAGTRAPALFVMLAGQAEVLDGGRVTAVLETGDIAGEMSLVTGKPASATVRARNKCWVIALSADDFATILSARPEARAYVDAEIAARSEGQRRVRWG